MSGKRRADGPPQKARTGAKGAKDPKGPKRALWKRLLLWFTVLFLSLSLVAVGSFIVLYQSIDIPDPNSDFQTQTTKIYYSGGDAEIGSFATQNRESINFDEMPETARDAVVAAEDRSFWTNRGIDPKGILRAAFSNASGGSTQGASTITQQYVKILYLTQERTLTRKAKEAILSLKIQRQLSKEQVLEGYLNTIYFGRGAYGLQAAAQAYFGVPAGELTLPQSAVLASVINNPTRFDPANGPDAEQRLLGRYQYVLDGMVEAGDISAADADAVRDALPEFPVIEQNDTYGGQSGHMLTLVREELSDLGFSASEIDGGGLRVETTFTEQAMQAAADGVAEEFPEGFANYYEDPEQNQSEALHVGVAMVEPNTGALKGFYGGQDYLDSQLNWAAQLVQPGSTFKAFAVAAALTEGYSLRDRFNGNSPFRTDDGSEIENQGNRSYGQVSLETATEDSINTAFIELTEDMEEGPQQILGTANRLGIPSNDGGDFGIPTESRGLDTNLGVSLGSGDVSPINMAAAYGAIANDGVYNPVHVVQRVTDRFGTVKYEHEKAPERAISSDVAADTSYALQQVVQQGSGTRAGEIDRPAAGKTGTATNDDGEVSSSWFVGYTPQLATAVTYVRGTGRMQLQGWLPEYFGGRFPAQTWAEVMERALAGTEEMDFPDPVFLDGDSGRPQAPQGGGNGNGNGGGSDDDDEPSQAPSTTAPPATTAPPTSAPVEPEPTEEPPPATGTGEPTPDPEPSGPPTGQPTGQPTGEPTGILPGGGTQGRQD